MVGLHENQKRILEYLLGHPDGATLVELSKHLGISKTATKEHILRIDHLGLLIYQDSRGGVGRPLRRYLLSQQGQETFPRQYAWMSNALLEHLAEDMGQESLSEMMQSLAVKVANSMKDRLPKDNAVATLNAIAECLSELGYRAALKQTDLRKGAVIEATNCVYHSVAKKHPALCSFDTKFIEEASGGMKVRLECCIAKGASTCRFKISR